MHVHASGTTSISSVREKIRELLHVSLGGRTSTKTRAGWCLLEGLCHVAYLENQLLLPRILHHGVPTFYLKNTGASRCRHDATQDLKDPQTCFQSLCRIIAGQFVSGKSAQASWKRLLALAESEDTTNETLTPEMIVSRYRNDIENFQKAAGLTRAKSKAILDLAERFADQRLSEEMLESSTEDQIREALMQVWGIGEWSCNMFLLFYLERPNILPLGDLGVRKGLAKQFSLRGSAAKQQICPKKDLQRIQQRLGNYSPYFSLLSYYMWRVAETPEITSPFREQGESQDESCANRSDLDDDGPKITESPPPDNNQSTPSKRRRTNKRTVTP